MGKKDSTRPAQHLKVPMAAANMRIGLLGGSFNPAHAAHRQISLAALKRLRLDQVWWLVSPSNPLKAKAMSPDLETRVEAAREVAGREVAHHPKIVVTGFEAGRNSAYTVDTIRFLKRRYPSVNFVWLMGADNLVSFHRWRAWETLFRLMPIAVLDRPGYRLKARASRAAQRFASAALDETDAPGLPGMEPLSSLSSTRLRGAKSATPAGVTPRKAAKAAKKEVKKVLKAAKRRVKKDAKQAKRDAKATTKSKKKT